VLLSRPPQGVRPFPLRFCPSLPALTVGQLANYPIVTARCRSLLFNPSRSDSAFAIPAPPRYFPTMSVEQIELKVAKLERDQFARFSAWFENFRADAWDKQISSDAESGKFDAVF